MPQKSTTQASLTASLYLEAVRQGQSLWFRVASNSMNPLLRIGDQVYIVPAKAGEIRCGEIAAFETSDGFLIHRIIQRQQTGTTVRLLQMADVELHASWVEEQAVIGRVAAARRETLKIDLQHPIAQRCGSVTAYLRHWLYTYKRKSPFARLLHGCSRLVAYVGYWCIRSFCSSAIAKNESV